MAFKIISQCEIVNSDYTLNQVSRPFAECISQFMIEGGTDIPPPSRLLASSPFPNYNARLPPAVKYLDGISCISRFLVEEIFFRYFPSTPSITIILIQGGIFQIFTPRPFYYLTPPSIITMQDYPQQ